MTDLIFKKNNYPFIVILAIFLWLCDGLFGLLPLSRVMFIVYVGVWFFLRNKDTTFSRPVSILMISMILSMFSCLLFHGQSLFNSLPGYVTYGAIVIYFVLFKIRLSPNVVERLIFWMFIIFCVCYIYQVIVFPKPVFILSGDNFNEGLDILLRRIRMPGMSLVGIGLFYSLNKLLLGNYKYLAFVVLAAVVMMLFGFRTLLFFSILFSIWMIVKINGFSYRLIVGIIVLLIIIWGFSLTTFGQETFAAMLERQENDQNFGNKDYIRYTTLIYYYSQHFSNFIEFLLGSGIPNRLIISNYGRYYDNLESFGIHYYDWGILGMSWMMGLMSLIAMVWYSVKAFFTKVPRNKLYLTLWFGYLLACGFTSAEFVRQGCFLIQGMVLYLIHVYSDEKNNSSK